MFSLRFLFTTARQILGIIYLSYCTRLERLRDKFTIAQLRKCKPVKEGHLRIVEVKHTN